MEIFIVYHHEFNPYGNNATHWEKELIKDIDCVFKTEKEAEAYCDKYNEKFAEWSYCYYKYKRMTLK